MESDPYKLLNQLVVAALTVFIALIVLLAALLIRHMWLQQHIVALSSDLQVNMDELAVIAEEIQSGLAENQANAGQPASDESGAEMTELADNLEDLDKQLSSIEEDLNQVAQVLESDSDPSITTPDETAAPLGRIQYQVNQVFTVIAGLVAIASVVIAILLGMALRVQHTGNNHHTDPPQPLTK